MKYEALGVGWGGMGRGGARQGDSVHCDGCRARLFRDSNEFVPSPLPSASSQLSLVNFSAPPLAHPRVLKQNIKSVYPREAPRFWFPHKPKVYEYSSFLGFFYIISSDFIETNLLNWQITHTKKPTSLHEQTCFIKTD